MKLYYLLLTVLFVGCTNIPEAPTSNAAMAKEKIQYNKTEAEQAKDDYLKLQKKRNDE